MTLWDCNYSDLSKLEQWLYGEQSLSGATRTWMIREAKKWPLGTEFLDAGCGGGVTAYQFDRAGILNKVKYTGVDFSKCMLDLAQKKVKHPNAKWICSPLETFSSVDEFDHIQLRAVLAHTDQPIPILKNMMKALKKKGLLYIVFWNNPPHGESVVSKTPEGFFDIGHSRRMLEKAIEEEGGGVAAYHSVEEKSARHGYREIWVVARG